MRHLYLGLVMTSIVCQAQIDSADVAQKIKHFQEELDREYRDSKTTPLRAADLKTFKGHNFYPIDLRYVVVARLTYTPDAPFVPFPATGKIVNTYRSFAVAEFELAGETHRLTIYQSKSLMNHPEYKDYLFLPFTDLTTGDETYGGGRYVDLRLPPEGAPTLVLNFHLSYNPYCAYSDRYSCPLVPKNNHLNVAIRAGVFMEGGEK
jgi:uncharacterized protein (DUF1684 family)